MVTTSLIEQGNNPGSTQLSGNALLRAKEDQDPPDQLSQVNHNAIAALQPLSARMLIFPRSSPDKGGEDKNQELAKSPRLSSTSGNKMTLALKAFITDHQLNNSVSKGCKANIVRGMSTKEQDTFGSL
ncbi:hypothetical protein JCM3770_002395 [Rhodotorula araucariae]